MSDKNDVSTTERVAQPGGKKAAIKRHCARFWWIHLIIFILVAVFVILITIFVAIPRIAQDKINQAKLDIVGVTISDATPTSYTMKIESSIKTDGTVKADIDPFMGDMYLEDTPDQTPFATFMFPPTNADKFSWVNFTRQIEIQDMDAFQQFNTWFVNNETLNIGIKGKTQVQPKGLSKKYGVTFHKILPTKGLNLFKGMKVNNAKVDIGKTNGTNFNATAILPNPSHFTLDIGNATFDNDFLGVNLGQLQIDNLFLQPGDNEVAVKGLLDQIQIISLAGAHKPYCETGVVPFSLIGTNVTNHGQQIPYFEYALAHANQTVQLNVSDTLVNSGVDAGVACSKNAN